MLFPKPEKRKRLKTGPTKKACQICGYWGALTDHHIKSFASGGNNEPDNLITVCHHCHRKIHNGKISRAEVRAAKEMEAMKLECLFCDGKLIEIERDALGRKFVCLECGRTIIAREE